MKKIMFCVIFSLFFLTACSSNGSNSTNKVASDKIKKPNKQENVAAPNKTITNNTINYNQFTGKTWIKKNGSYNTSFCISSISNGKITGYLDSLYAVPTTYDFKKNLTGTINKDTAECQLNDSKGNKGTVKLVFKENNQIEATINLTAKSQNTDMQPQEGTFEFIPYNLSSIKGFSLLKDQSFMVNLNSWGNVRFVSGKLTAGNHVPVVFYLTDNQGNLLFDFNPSLPYNVDVKAVSFVDLNKNGLKDVIIIVGANGASQLATVYFQNTNGSFTNNPNLDQKINNSGNNKSVKNVESYLSQNLKWRN